MNEHGRNRTCDPQNRNLMLYPLSYMPNSFRSHINTESERIGKLTHLSHYGLAVLRHPNVVDFANATLRERLRSAH